MEEEISKEILAGVRFFSPELLPAGFTTHRVNLECWIYLPKAELSV